MKKKIESLGGNVFAALLCFSLFAFYGCGGSPRVHGTITFDNGELLKTGLVVFESSKANYQGDVQSNGTFSMGTTKNGQGIPPGEYKVYFQNAHEVTRIDEENRPIYRPLLDNKFYSPETSELTCTVKGKTKFDIHVTAPK